LQRRRELEDIVVNDFDPLAMMLDPEASPEDVKLAVAIAPWPELREARRLLRLLRGANEARLAQVKQEMRELERRHPGIEDE
jgi:hypothetical protein